MASSRRRREGFPGMRKLAASTIGYVRHRMGGGSGESAQSKCRKAYAAGRLPCLASGDGPEDQDALVVDTANVLCGQMLSFRHMRKIMRLAKSRGAPDTLVDLLIAVADAAGTYTARLISTSLMRDGLPLKVAVVFALGDRETQDMKQRRRSPKGSIRVALARLDKVRRRVKFGRPIPQSVVGAAVRVLAHVLRQMRDLAMIKIERIVNHASNEGIVFAVRPVSVAAPSSSERLRTASREKSQRSSDLGPGAVK